MKIGNIELGNKPLFLAPMEDVTDPSFRYMCKRFGADVVTTEFISSDGLIRDAWKSRAKLNIDEAERPVGIQIYGHLIEPMVEAARIAEEALANLQNEQERLISQTRAEQARLMQEAAAERDRMIAQAQEQARAEAQKIMDDARIRINEEKEAAMKEVRNEVAKVSLAIAEKVVRKELSSETSQKELVDSLVDKL